VRPSASGVLGIWRPRSLYRNWKTLQLSVQTVVVGSPAIGEITPEQPQFSADYSISRRLDDCGY
jgi:hypothetical protein